MPNEIERVVLEAAKRKEREIRWKPETWFHPKQLIVFRDPSRYRCMRVGRRGGKSWFWAGCLVDEGYKHPKSTPLFVTMSRQDARDIIWPALDALNEEFQLGLEFNRSTGDVTMPNGSRIMLRGAGTLREINKLRGKKYPCAIVDEAQAFGSDLDYLLDQVIEPAVADYHGWIGVSGTPAVAPAGPFYEIDQGEHAEAWSHHYWTFLDNPHMPNPEEFIAKVMKRRGWDEEHPGYLREYMGLWVHDKDARAFKIEPHRDIVPSFDPSNSWDWDYVMGIDVGYNDPFAFVVLAQSQVLGQAFVIDSYEESGITTMEALVTAERFCQDYPITRIALDTGGAGKLVSEDWKKMSTLPLEPAKKTHKASQVSIINGDFRAGKLKVCREKNIKLISDLMVLEWDKDQVERDRWVYRRGFADHLADALQYAYNLCFHHTFDPMLDTRVPSGSTEWYDRLEMAMEKRQTKDMEERTTQTGDIFDLLQP